MVILSIGMMFVNTRQAQLSLIRMVIYWNVRDKYFDSKQMIRMETQMQMEFWTSGEYSCKDLI